MKDEAKSRYARIKEAPFHGKANFSTIIIRINIGYTICKQYSILGSIRIHFEYLF